MQREDDHLEEALTAAEEKAREVLERLLGDRSSTYTILLRLEEDPRGGYKLGIEIEASRPRARWIREVVEEATREAAREFEKRLRAYRKPSRGSKGSSTNP